MNARLTSLCYSQEFQCAMIALICVNFCLSILDFEFGIQYQEVEAEVDGAMVVTVEKIVTEEYFHETLAVLEAIFVTIFTLEVLLNLYVNGFWKFFKVNVCRYDCVCVCVYVCVCVCVLRTCGISATRSWFMYTHTHTHILSDSTRP